MHRTTANGEPTEPTATGNGPTDGDRASDAGRWKPRVVKVGKQEIRVDSEEKALELMQKGAAFERNLERINREREEADRAARERENTLLKRFEPLIAVDELLRQDPDKRERINAILADRDLPPNPDVSDDPTMAEIQRLNKRIAQLEGGVSREVGGLKTGFDQIRRSNDLAYEERQLRKQYPKLATDERVYEARKKAEATGASLTTAFRDAFFDESLEAVREDTLNEFGFDPGAMHPDRSESVVLEGIGPLTDEVRQKIYADPDLYERWKPQMDEDRRRRTGKQPYPK